MSAPVAELMIPIVMFISLAVVVSLFFVYRHRNKRELQATIRTAIDKGQELTPEIIERLGSPPPAPDRDMRRGIISLAIAFALVAFGYAIGDEDALRAMLGTSAFPFAIGAAFLLMHFIGKRG